MVKIDKLRVQDYHKMRDGWTPLAQGSIQNVCMELYGSWPFTLIITAKMLAEVRVLQDSLQFMPVIDKCEIEITASRQINETGRPDYNLRITSGHLINLHLSKGVFAVWEGKSKDFNLEANTPK